MREAGVGRVLVASFHQGIADILPTRLPFYENWLSTTGLREGTIGLAPFHAVLSFLRREGGAYELITARAGEYAAVWTVEALSRPRRTLIAVAPIALRLRLVAWLVRDLIRTSYRGSRAIVRVRQGIANIEVRASIFCTVREPTTFPLCGFYTSAFTRLLSLFQVEGHAELVSCRGTGEPSCMLKLAAVSGRPRKGAKLRAEVEAA